MWGILLFSIDRSFPMRPNLVRALWNSFRSRSLKPAIMRDPSSSTPSSVQGVA